MKSPDQLLAKAVHRAIGLPSPAEIARTILSSTAAAHNGLRAATYEARVRGTGVDSDTDDDRVHLTTTERLAAARMDGTRDTRTELDQLRNLSRASQRYVDAIGALDAICLDAPPPDTWEEALHDANLLCETGTVTSALDLGYDVTSWCNQACDSVATIAEIATRYQPRTASQDEQHWTSGLADEEVCAWHLEVHVRYRRPRVRGTNLCADCLTVAELFGSKPPRWLIEAMIDHGDRPIAWRASLSRAMDELGIVRSA